MKNLNMEAAKKRYNELMDIAGREYKTIGTKHSEGTEGWNLRDMVSECAYVLSSYYEGGGCNGDKQYSDDPEERKEWRSHTGKLERFIKAYEPFIEGLVCTTKHGSKYDNVQEEKTVNKLQAVRQAAGLTQQQLADQTGISLSSIQKYERGAKDINRAGIVFLTKLCDALNCQVQDIVTDPKIIQWAEQTPPAMKALQATLAEAQVEYELKQTAGMLKELRDKRNGIKPEPKPVVKRTTEKVKKTITMEVEFLADFMPPDEFDFDDWNSKCSLCPFYVDATDYGTWCQHPECGEDNSCPIKKYF